MTGMAFDPAKLAPKDLQCFLLDEIKKLCANAPKAGEYNWLGRISGHPGDVISQLQHGNKTAQAESILDLCPDIYGLLVPYIKIYRVVYAPGNPFQIQAIQELPFKNFVPEEDITAMLRGGYGRTSGAGIKSFQWNLVGVNPAEVDNNITANLTMHFQSLYDLFRYNLGPSGYQGGIAGQPGYLDLIIQPRGTVDSAASAPGDPNPDRPCEGAHHQMYNGVDFRIKAVVGWSTPPGFDSLDIPGYSAADLTALKTAIDATRIGLFLQVTRHEIDFNEDGSLTLSIDYQAALSGKLTAPIADIFAGETYWRARALNRDGSESATRQAQIEDLEEQYQDVVETEVAAQEAGDDTASAAATAQADELSEEIDKLKRHQRYIKYHSVLEPLYKDKKIYTIPIQAKELYERRLNNPNLTAEERAQLAVERERTPLEITTPEEIDEAFLEAVAASRSGSEEDPPDDGSIQWRHEDGKDIILINFFYLGDLIDSILSRLSHLGENGNFQLLLGDVEVIDPLQAFQVKSVNISCGGDSTAVKKLSEVNPLKHRGLNDITLRTNIADLPISLDLFRSWFKSTIIAHDISEYYLLHFICDICQDLISHSLSSGCYNNEFNYMINFATNTFDLSKSFQGALVSLSDVAAAKGIADKQSTNQNPGSQPLSTLVMYCRDSTPKATAVPADDLKKGIYHYYMGASCGLVKSVNFTRHDQPHLREAKIQRYGALGAEQLRELYILNLRLVGNTLHKNGQYLYFNPTAIGAGDLVSKGTMPNLARLLGLGGYFMITDIEHKIEAKTFEVLLKGYQEGIAFEQEGVSSINYHDVEDPGPGNEDDDSASAATDDAAGSETGETEGERSEHEQLVEDVEAGAGVAD